MCLFACKDTKKYSYAQKNASFYHKKYENYCIFSKKVVSLQQN